MQGSGTQRKNLNITVARDGGNYLRVSKGECLSQVLKEELRERYITLGSMAQSGGIAKCDRGCDAV